MARIIENFPLKPLNTFGIDVYSRYFARVETIDELTELLANNRELFPFLILGGGSNILFTKNYDGLVIQPGMKGIMIIDDDLEQCVVEAGAGVNWDDFVKWAVDNRLGGIENLSLIPGSTGSSPIQNIGAYGVEVKEVIDKVNYLDLETLRMDSVTNEQCQFGYRTSVFKNTLKNRAVITSVIFRLRHNPLFNTTYGDLREETEKLGGENLENIRKAVIRIRESKLPDPLKTGNAGSFFKNPVIGSITAEELKSRYTAMPLFTVDEQWTKIPAGWLIEQCGWKGSRRGDAGVHDRQALVLVNHGNAKGEEIIDLARQISESVYERFGIQLEPEVNIV